MLSQPQKIRVMFSKTGSLKFISHLDLNRTVRSAFLRSRLPIWYTKGFNPHPKTVFSVPLSVGTASLCEFMDFRVTEEITGEQICERLNAVFPAGLRAIAAYEPTTKFHDIGWADYELCFEIADASGWVEPVREALSGEIVIDKTTKVGTRTVDITSLVRVISVDVVDEKLVLKLRLSADDASYVNPKYIVEFMTTKLGIPGEKDDYTVCRTSVYGKDGETIFR